MTSGPHWPPGSGLRAPVMRGRFDRKLFGDYHLPGCVLVLRLKPGRVFCGPCGVKQVRGFLQAVQESTGVASRAMHWMGDATWGHHPKVFNAWLESQI